MRFLNSTHFFTLYTKFWVSQVNMCHSYREVKVQNWWLVDLGGAGRPLEARLQHIIENQKSDQNRS
jgi:hypothetical protein